MFNYLKMWGILLVLLPSLAYAGVVPQTISGIGLANATGINPFGASQPKGFAFGFSIGNGTQSTNASLITTQNGEVTQNIQVSSEDNEGGLFGGLLGSLPLIRPGSPLPVIPSTNGIGSPSLGLSIGLMGLGLNGYLPGAGVMPMMVMPISVPVTIPVILP